MALNKLVFMPFGYLVDKYRWDLFSGWADKNDLNCHWVKQRIDIQGESMHIWIFNITINMNCSTSLGVAPPNQRSEEDFDPGAKYHVAGNVRYVRYFTAHIYEFQFYRELCLVSGEYVPGDPSKPLHRCNFYGIYFGISALHSLCNWSTRSTHSHGR